MEKLTATDYNKKKTRERRKKEHGYFKHLKNLWNALKGQYPSPCFPCDKNGDYNEEDPA